MSYDGKILHADAYTPCPKHLLGVISKGVVVTKNDIFNKPESRPTDSQRQARRGHRPRPVLLIALLLIAQVAYGAAGWLAACRAVTDLSGKQLVPYKYLSMYTRLFCLAVKQN